MKGQRRREIAALYSACVWLKCCRGPSIPVKHAGRKKRAPSRKGRGSQVGMTVLRLR
jgi:hypothetical protein